MKLINDFDQIREQIVFIRNLKKGFITNFFLSEDKCNLLINKNLFYCINFEECNCFLFKDYDFYHIYYVSTSTSALESTLSKICENYKQIFVIDIIDKNVFKTGLIDTLEKIGFSQYCRLTRMSRIVDSEIFTNVDSRISLPEFEDSQQILELFLEHFDKYSEQIPLIEEIRGWIEKGTILVIKEKTSIIGFVIFEIIGQTSYLRYWFTHPNHRDKKIGSTLLRRFFYECRLTKKQYFWVIDTNENAILRYQHYGFQPESMCDQVMIKKL